MRKVRGDNIGQAIDGCSHFKVVGALEVLWLRKIQGKETPDQSLSEWRNFSSQRTKTPGITLEDTLSSHPTNRGRSQQGEGTEHEKKGVHAKGS